MKYFLAKRSHHNEDTRWHRAEAVCINVQKR